jgi:hypothetical protein
VFVGPAPSGHECCHRDGDPSNNDLANLYWGTPSQNRSDAVRHGTHCGLTPKPKKLTAEQVSNIRSEYGPYTSMRRLAASYGVSANMICLIINNQSWAA